MISFIIKFNSSQFSKQIGVLKLLHEIISSLILQVLIFVFKIVLLKLSAFNCKFLSFNLLSFLLINCNAKIKANAIITTIITNPIVSICAFFNNAILFQVRLLYIH